MDLMRSLRIYDDEVRFAFQFSCLIILITRWCSEGFFVPTGVKSRSKFGRFQVQKHDFDGEGCCPVALTKHHLVAAIRQQFLLFFILGGGTTSFNDLHHLALRSQVVLGLPFGIQGMKNQDQLRSILNLEQEKSGKKWYPYIHTKHHLVNSLSPSSGTISAQGILGQPSYSTSNLTRWC